MENLKIIKVTDVHLNDFLEPLAKLFDKYRQFYKQPSNMLQSKSFIRNRTINKDSVIFIALNSCSIIVGFAQLYPSYSSISTKKKWILNDLFVLKNYRRQGIATQLLSKIRQFAIETKAGSLFLETQVSNVSAQTLYESFGYVRENEHHTYILKISTP